MLVKRISRMTCAAAAAAALALAGCGHDKPSKPSDPGATEEAAGENPGDPTAPGEPAKPSQDAQGEQQDIGTDQVKIRNFNSFQFTLEQLLELKDTDLTNFRTEFAKVSANLATTTQLDGITPATAMAITKISAFACDLSFQSAPAEKKERIFGVDAKTDQPLVALGNPAHMAATMFSHFHGIEVAENDPQVAIMTTLVKGCTQELLVGVPNADNATIIRAGALCMCSTALGSAGTWLY